MSQPSTNKKLTFVPDIHFCPLVNCNILTLFTGDIIGTRLTLYWASWNSEKVLALVFVFFSFWRYINGTCTKGRRLNSRKKKKTFLPEIITDQPSRVISAEVRVTTGTFELVSHDLASSRVYFLTYISRDITDLSVIQYDSMSEEQPYIKSGESVVNE